MGERLAVDPNDNSILFFGARSGNGLWKSTNSASTWTQVTSFPSVGECYSVFPASGKAEHPFLGTYAPDPSDPTGYESDLIGIAWVTFDSTSGTKGTATPRIFVGVVSDHFCSVADALVLILPGQQPGPRKHIRD